MDKSSMDNRALQKIAGILWCPDLKRNIIILIVFFLVYLALGNATGINSSSPEESADILNESLLSQDETFRFGILNILDGNNNPLFCSVTFYDNAGILKVSDFTNTLSIEKINPGSHLNIESNDNNILLDFSINGDSFDPVVRIADYGISNPTSNYELHGSPLKYISVDASNLSYSNLRMAISYSGMDENIDTNKLKIFKYVETFAYNEWIELPTHVDELNQAVWTDVDSTSIFAVSITDSTAHPQNITIGDVSLLNSIGISRPGEITIIGPEGNIIAGSAGTLTLDEVPSGSHLNINSSEINTRLDFILNADSSNPVILLEDFGTNNPAGNYLPSGEPVTYLMVGAENLGYSGVNLTLYYPDISGNFSIFRLSETFAYNEWEELPAVVDTANNTITTSLDSLSIFALSKITPVGVRVLDNTNAPLTVGIKTYDSNEKPGIVKRGHTLSVDELPRPGYIAIDALVEKDVAVVFKSSYSSGGEIVLDNYARHNPEAIDPNRMPVKFVEIHARNLIFDSADIEIHYSDDEIGSLDENKLQISHFSGGAWVTLDSTVDPVNNMVRASTDSLSTFALVYNGTSVNTKKSIYQPGETAEIMIVVLDSAGAPVSDASIRMNVTAPEGSVEFFSTLAGNIVETPDPGVYEAAYLTGGEGRYNISCTAIIEGSESRFDTYFMVLSEYDFDIIRHAQGKIDPTKYDTFGVGVDIISYTDADSIIIWEYVPAVFEVYTDASVVEADNLKVLTWQRSLVNNRTSVNYSYSVPMEWPKLYQLGPVEIDYGNKTFTEARPWYVAVDPDAYLILFWDNETVAAPSGWTCISDDDGEDFYQRFPRGNATYGGTGVATTHNHSVSLVSCTGPSTNVTQQLDYTLEPGSSTHTHNLTQGSTDEVSLLPQYRSLKIIRYDAGIPTTIPVGAIAIFNTTPPSNWTANDSQDGYFVMGNESVATGGSNTHNHSVSITTGGPTSWTYWESQNDDWAGSKTHTHSGLGTTASSDHRPPYLEVIFAKADSDTTIPAGMIAMFNATPPSNWTVMSGTEQDFADRFIVGNSTNYGNKGGSANHTHSNLVITTGVPSAKSQGKSGGGTQATAGSDDHTHDMEVSFSSENNLPPYIDVIFAYYVAEPPPDTTLPEWQNQGENTTTPVAGDSVLLYAQGRDETALNWATLSTNESGAWVNYTDGTHGSPINMGNAKDAWVPSNFTWQNSSVTAGTTVGWRIWYNDTSGNWNCTDVRTLVVQAAAPSATSRWNNKTNNDSLTLTINVSEEIEFGIVYDQTGNITWNATGYTDRSNLSVLSGNQTYNWSTSGTKYLNASMNNTNGTSSITSWSIIVQSISDAPNITSFAPTDTTPNDVEGAARTFNITVNQTVNVSWQINGTEVGNNTSVTNAEYTNTSAEVGYWNVSAIVTNAKGSDIQTWWWTVSAAPNATSWWNNKTNNDLLTLTINTTEIVKFGVKFNQTGNITWNATNHPIRFNDSTDSGNRTFSWDTPGIKHLNVSMKNDNGTSDTLTWNITVTPPIIYVNETGWWFEHGQFNQSNTPIQSAVDNASNGSYIFVYNGSYSENVVIDKPVTLEGEGMDVVEVSAKTNSDVFQIRSSWVNISGFTIKSSINSGIYLYEADHCNISWNNVSNNWYYGIYLHRSNYNNISNNIVMDNHRDGSSGGKAIYIHGYSEHNTITDNTIEHNIYGIFIDSGSGNNTVHTNVVKDNREGVYVAARYNLIYNNYILFNKNYDAKDIMGGNRWNITKTSGINIIGGSHLGGNYYSDYTGSDEEGDGLGDTPYLIMDKDTEDHHPLVSSIRMLERWNSKTLNDNLTLTVNISESVDFRIRYNQTGDIRWRSGIEYRENQSCPEATQTYSWSNPGTVFVDVWLTNDNGTSNKTEWVITVNTNVEGKVKDDSSNLTSNITYYDTDGETVLHNITSHEFNFTGVPMYGHLEIDAFSTKNTSIRFCISGKSENVVITIEETKENPATFEPSGIPIKYIRANPGSLAYNSSFIKIRYSEDELDGVSEGSLTIYRMWGSSWSPLDTQRDTENNILTAPITGHPEWFMVACPTGAGICKQLLIRTDRAVYLLDPHSWVYEAPYAEVGAVTEFEGGHGQDVTLNVMVLDYQGYLVSGATVAYTVSNSSGVQISGTASETVRDGFYQDVFVVNETVIGVGNATISVTATNGTVTVDDSIVFHVGRWGCDSCHKPTDNGSHNGRWTEVIGNSTDSGGSVLYTNLTNASLTHLTPATTKYSTHENVSKRGSIDSSCRVCHTSSESVNCTQCHTDYLLGQHTNVVVGTSPSTSCSNASCHGHLTTSSVPGNVDNRYPNCSACHPISFGSEVPQWLNTSTGETRDVGGHPSGDNPVVNCSFCHNSFHSLFNESDVLSCNDCHPESKDYPQHPYEGYQGDTATCANCHCGADHLNIHNITIPRCSDCHLPVYDDISDGYDNYAMKNDSENLAPAGSNMTHKRDTRVALSWGSDPQGLSGSGNRFYSRHAYPNSSGGWPDATGQSRNGDQICINCHSEIVRDAGAWHDENWKRDSYYSCKPCHNIWQDDAICGSPNVHYLSVPHCTDCHAATLPDPWHGTWDPANPPKNYMRTPVIGLMLEDSIHNRLILNTTTDKPSNYLGCLICHTDVVFSINYGDFEITITDYDGVHTWNSKPACTKCHSLSGDISRPGPSAYAHDLLEGIEWGNNTQCLKCHNIYDQTAGRYHGHDATTESCTACHYNYTAMNNYGTPSVYVNETMYESSVHGTEPGTNCTLCHTNYHPPPEYTWKWCECCHSYQSDPINENDRHNVTADPLSYSVNVSGTPTPVLNITDCTICHNATVYNTAKDTFNRSSGKDCRYCHTFPDQTYD